MCIAYRMQGSYGTLYRPIAMNPIFSHDVSTIHSNNCINDKIHKQSAGELNQQMSCNVRLNSSLLLKLIDYSECTNFTLLILALQIKYVKCLCSQLAFFGHILMSIRAPYESFLEDNINVISVLPKYLEDNIVIILYLNGWNVQCNYIGLNVSDFRSKT